MNIWWKWQIDSCQQPNVFFTAAYRCLEIAGCQTTKHCHAIFARNMSFHKLLSSPKDKNRVRLKNLTGVLGHSIYCSQKNAILSKKRNHILSSLVAKLFLPGMHMYQPQEWALLLLNMIMCHPTSCRTYLCMTCLPSQVFKHMQCLEFKHSNLALNLHDISFCVQCLHFETPLFESGLLNTNLWTFQSQMSSAFTWDELTQVHRVRRQGVPMMMDPAPISLVSTSTYVKCDEDAINGMVGNVTHTH